MMLAQLRTLLDLMVVLAVGLWACYFIWRRYRRRQARGSRGANCDSCGKCSP